MERATKRAQEHDEFKKMIFLLYLNPNRLPLTMAYKIATDYFKVAPHWKNRRIPSLSSIRRKLRTLPPEVISIARG